MNSACEGDRLQFINKRRMIKYFSIIHEGNFRQCNFKGLALKMYCLITASPHLLAGAELSVPKGIYTVSTSEFA